MDYIQLQQVLVGLSSFYQVSGEINASRVAVTYNTLANKNIAAGYIQTGSYGIDTVELNDTGTGWSVRDHWS